MIKIIRSSIRWIGGKGKKLKRYLQLIPEHKVFTSAFCGGCHVELAKKPSKFELVNDKNNDLINFLLTLKDYPEELYQKCSALPYSEALFKKYKWEEKPQNSLERAVRFFYIVMCGFSGGGHKYKTGFSISITQHSSKVQSYYSAIENLKIMATRIKQWHILNRDFENVILKYDTKDTFHFVDSPYVGCEDLYSGGFKKIDHLRLRKTLDQIKGKAMVCYYQDPLINELYKDWYRVEYKTKSRVQKRDLNEKCPTKIELILLNYDPNRVIA